VDDFFGYYTAISYVQGNPTETRAICVDDIPLQITANLFSVLRDSRDETRALRLWADAVCINQSNPNERVGQVSLMGKIYASALRTIVFLGPSEPVARESYCLSTVQESSVKCTTKLRESADFLLGSDWFTRVWVFQKVYSPATLGFSVVEAGQGGIIFINC